MYVCACVTETEDTKERDDNKLDLTSPKIRSERQREGRDQSKGVFYCSVTRLLQVNVHL